MPWAQLSFNECFKYSCFQSALEWPNLTWDLTSSSMIQPSPGKNNFAAGRAAYFFAMVAVWPAADPWGPEGVGKWWVVKRGKQQIHHEVVSKYINGFLLHFLVFLFLESFSLYFRRWDAQGWPPVPGILAHQIKIWEHVFPTPFSRRHCNRIRNCLDYDFPLPRLISPRCSCERWLSYGEELFLPGNSTAEILPLLWPPTTGNRFLATGRTCAEGWQCSGGGLGLDKSSMSRFSKDIAQFVQQLSILFSPRKPVTHGWPWKAGPVGRGGASHCSHGFACGAGASGATGATGGAPGGTTQSSAPILPQPTCARSSERFIGDVLVFWCWINSCCTSSPSKKGNKGLK